MASAPTEPSRTPAEGSAPSGDSSSSNDFATALSTISPLEDLQRLPSIPCARYSLLFGIVAGTSVGALRFVFSRGTGAGGRMSEVGRAANWAVGAWGVGSLGAWETCRRRQTSESTKMAALVLEVKARRAAKSAPNPALPAGSAPENIRLGKKGQPGGVMLSEEQIAELRRRRAKEIEEERRTGVKVGEAAKEADSEGVKKGSWWGK